MTLGTKITQLRRNRNLTQVQIAEELQVSQNAYNKWESDKAKPSMENLMKLAEFHNKDIYELLDDSNSFNLINPTFNDNSAVQNNNPVYNNSSEAIEQVLKSHEKIISLIEIQNKIISELLKK